jgi:hypothetical protein
VQQVQVDAVQAQALQAAFAGSHDAGSAGVFGQHLADDEQFFAPQAGTLGLRQGLPQHPFAAPLRIHLGRVEDAVADLQRLPQQAHFIRGSGRVRTQPVHAQAQGAAPFSTGKADFARKGLRVVHTVIVVQLNWARGPLQHASASACTGFLLASSETTKTMRRGCRPTVASGSLSGFA